MLNFRQTVALILLFIGLGGCQARGVFRPLPNTPAPAGTISNLALAITFPDLQADPAGYLNQMIRVTGTFTALSPNSCPHLRGPHSQWALIADDLRMDMIGFEEILKLLPADTLMTVDGYWQQYRGPLGCGKEPPIDTAWYLHVTRLIQPNPLPAFELANNGNLIVFATLPAVIGDPPLTTATPPPTTNSTLPIIPLASDTPVPTVTPLVGTPILPPTATNTLPAGVTPPTNTPTTIPLATIAATTPAPTAPTPTQSPTPTPTATTTLPPNPQPSATPAPPGPTSSPPPYPSPLPTGYP